MNTVGKDHIQKDVGRRICCVKAVGKGFNPHYSTLPGKFFRSLCNNTLHLSAVILGKRSILLNLLHKVRNALNVRLGQRPQPFNAVLAQRFLALNVAVRGQKIVMASFGAGLVWNANYIEY